MINIIFILIVDHCFIRFLIYGKNIKFIDYLKKHML